MKRIVTELVVAGLLFLAGAVVAQGQKVEPKSMSRSKAVKALLPPARPVVSAQLACEALLSTSIWEDPEQNGQITAENQTGTDKLAIRIKENAITFITRASVEAGIPEAAEFTIVSNEEDFLVAIYLDKGAISPSLNSLVLNKKNGFAVWTKSRPQYLLSQTPDVQSSYLVCR